MTIKYHNPVDPDAYQFNLEAFTQVIPQDSVALDIGAHGGYFSLLFAQCVGDNGKVIAFEPNPKTYSLLQDNIANNGKTNIETHNYACTKENKKYTFRYTDSTVYGNNTNGGYFEEIDSPSAEHIKNVHSELIDVDGVNVSEFLTNNYKQELDKIKFIKIDAEGYDKEIIKTLEPIIANSKPVIMTEAFQGLSESEVDDFYNTLTSMGYLIYDASPHNNINDCVGPLDKDEFSYFTYNIMKGENFFCFHKDVVSSYNVTRKVPGKTAVIIFGRNDGYKEKERFTIHVTKMLETFDEVIYIDWNSERGSFLYEIIDDIPKTGRLKHIVIPPEYAAMMTNYDPKAQPCQSVLSINLGFKRTDAEWVVVSTTDIIPPSKEMLNDFISKASKETFYTFSRRDIEYDDVITNMNNLDSYIDMLNTTTEPRYFPARVTPNDVWSIFNCCGDFQLATNNLWNKIRGYEELMMYACFVDTNAQKKAVINGFNLVPVYDVPLYHMSHKGMENDGSSPSKQHYNDPMQWVEYFGPYQHYGVTQYSTNADTWGFSNVDIEYEMI